MHDLRILLEGRLRRFVADHRLRRAAGYASQARTNLAGSTGAREALTTLTCRDTSGPSTCRVSTRPDWFFAAGHSTAGDYPAPPVGAAATAASRA